MRVGFVLHGHGSGALRAAVREHLKAAPPYVQTTRPGAPDEGGEAITVFYLE
jgi:DNA mismatch repair protein MutS2